MALEVEAVVSLGTAADEAWELWKTTPAGLASSVAHAAVTHPTQPESSSKGDKAKLAAATVKLLQNWNAGLQLLSPAITHPDEPRPLVLYGSTWAEGDRLPMLEMDFPAGLPSWMREQDGWAKRAGKDNAAKRRNITITVPKGVISCPTRTWFPLTRAVPRHAAMTAAPKKKGPIDPLAGSEAGAGRTRGDDG